MKIKAPWGCENPYCWDHVRMALLVFGIPVLLLLRSLTTSLPSENQRSSPRTPQGVETP